MLIIRKIFNAETQGCRGINPAISAPLHLCVKDGGLDSARIMIVLDKNK
jgi:hypothetical protein